MPMSETPVTPPTPPAPPANPKCTYADFKKVELKVAEVLSVTNHPNADKLYVLKLRVGAEERQIVAGLRPYYQPEQLQGKKIIIVANLEPRPLRGEISNGMLLAASDGTSVVFLTPERDIASGSSIQ
jgi:methionine--tRNA ligase beta chain